MEIKGDVTVVEEESQEEVEVDMIRLTELDKLKSVLPECGGEGGGEEVSQLDVILQAIEYIESLQRKCLGVAWGGAQEGQDYIQIDVHCWEETISIENINLYIEK